MFRSEVLVEERPRPERVAGLVVLRLEVAVNRGDDGDEAGQCAAGEEEAEDPGDDGHDALHLLAHQEVAEAARDDEVEDQDQDRILRVGRRRNDFATASAYRRRRGWRRGGGRGRGVFGHSVSSYILSAKSLIIGTRKRWPLTPLMMAMTRTT